MCWFVRYNCTAFFTVGQLKMPVVCRCELCHVRLSVCLCAGYGFAPNVVVGWLFTGQLKWDSFVMAISQKGAWQQYKIT